MKLLLKAEPRTKGQKLGERELAGVVYGKGLETKPIKLNSIEFNRVYALSGESSLIDLDLGGEKHKVIVKEIQRDLYKDWVRHVDLYQVNMKEAIETEIPLEFVGEAKAVRELGGILIKEITDLRIECLPGDLVNHIEVDISVLKEFDDTIQVADLALPEGITALQEPDTVIAMIARVKEEKAEEESEAVEGDDKEAGTEAKPEEKSDEAPAEAKE